MIDFEKFAGRSGGGDVAVFEEHDAGGQEQGFAKIVGDEDDGFIEAMREGDEFALKFGASDRIERAKRLVHQENGRIDREGAGNTDALTLAAGKFARVTSGIFAWIETDEMEEMVDAGGNASGIPVFETGNESNIFCDSEMRKEAGLLNDITDMAAQADGIPGDGGAAFDEDLAFGGNEHFINEAEKGGLAATAAAEEHERLAARNC